MTANSIIGTHANDADTLSDARRLLSSLRTFGGSLANTVLWIAGPVECEAGLDWDRTEGWAAVGCRPPDDLQWLPYSEKPFAAAAAEERASGQSAVFVWMDADTIVLDEPAELLLEPRCQLAYCPVMHNRSGSLHGQPPTEYWRLIYEELSLRDDELFPMLTRADQQMIRAYFHAGLIAVRPEKGILRRWARDFERLARNETLADMCRRDRTCAVFLHQAALVGAVLHSVSRNEMHEFSTRYNYPILFHRQYKSVHPFDSIEHIVTARLVISLDQLGPEWCDELKGPKDKLEWLKQNVPSPG